MFIRKAVLLLLLALLCHSQQIAQKKKPHDELLECYLKNRTKTEDCITEFWNKIHIIMKTGDPSLKIPLAEPLTIKQMTWEVKGPSFNIHCILTNYKIWGFSNSKSTAMTIDKLARTISFNTSTPYLNVLSDFSINGTVLLIPIKGNGKLSLNSTNVASNVKADVVQRGPGVQLQNIKSNVQFNNISFKLTETDTTDPIWEALTNLISENIEIAIEDVLPTINAKFSELTQEMSNEAYKNIPAEAFIA